MSKAKPSSIENARATGSRAALWKSAEQRKEERQEKTMAVLMAAAELFLERGSHRVSMNDIADELGITKPALYNYFGSKDEMLFECFRQSNLAIVAQLDSIENSEGEGLAKLKEFIRAYTRLITIDYGLVMIRLDDRELPDPLRKEVRQYKRDIDVRVRSMIVKGIEDGSIIDCNAKLATFAILGALNWMGQWFRSDGAASVDQVGNEFVERLTVGLEGQKH